jgi:Ca2+-binding RTX toxin-like protein
VTIDVGEGPDTFDFSSSTTNTVYVAPAGINNIIGGTGSDSLIGNNNGDILIGGAGNDGIVGGSGNDVLIGGAGTDALTGRGGDDTFVFRPGFGHDLVTDFSVGDAIHHDTLDLRGLGFTSIIDVLNHTDLGTSAVIHAGPDDITLLSVSKDMLALHAATILV